MAEGRDITYQRQFLASNQHESIENGLAFGQYASEWERERTFSRWSNPRFGSYRFTGSGFFYTGQNDLVRCFSCGLGLNNWGEHDDPLQVHADCNPNCAFIRRVMNWNGDLQEEDNEDHQIHIEEDEMPREGTRERFRESRRYGRINRRCGPEQVGQEVGIEEQRQRDELGVELLQRLIEPRTYRGTTTLERDD